MWWWGHLWGSFGDWPLLVGSLGEGSFSGTLSGSLVVASLSGSLVEGSLHWMDGIASILKMLLLASILKMLQPVLRRSDDVSNQLSGY